ncbi:hypothetical protein Leryth_002435 [Lithospermum erythrorhizon]|nr:hypothetical protein Leryth_002435 [Lithospermum erythrorhizon]
MRLRTTSIRPLRTAYNQEKLADLRAMHARSSTNHLLSTNSIFFVWLLHRGNHLPTPSATMNMNLRRCRPWESADGVPEFGSGMFVSQLDNLDQWRFYDIYTKSEDEINKRR